MSLSQDECQQKLEKLKLWQEKQKKILYDKQMEEKRLLSGTQQMNYDSFVNKSISNDNCDIINRENPGISESKTVVKKPFLKRGEGLKNRFGIDPNTFRLTNLPKYKFSKKIDNSNKFSLNRESGDNRLDKVEEETNKNYFSPTNPIPKRISPLEFNENQNIKTKERVVEQKANNEIRTWASVLDPTLKNPISIAQFKGPSISNPNVSQNEKEQLNLFELLEQKVNESCYSFNSTDIIELLKDKNLFPNNEISNCVITNEPLISSKEILENKLQTTLVPSPSELDDLKSNEVDSDTESCDSSFHVRFSDKVTINEINSDSDPDFENKESTLKPLNVNITSTPKEKLCKYSESAADENFEEVIHQILGLKQREIQEKSQLLDNRLKELEHEIAMFQQQNQVLTKMKQEHELEKIDMEKRFNQNKKALDDEKIKIEIYLNDEKSKLKEEKIKIEKKLSQPNKRDREEIFRLQDQIIELKEEIKAKETKHSSAQSRLRAQIRNLEKNLREKELEIENFKKENKKLEFENSRLPRQATSKMLNEINKNITKLAVANQLPLPTSNSKNDDDDKNRKSPTKQTKPKIKTVKTKRATILSSSTSSVSSKSHSSSSDSDDECETVSIDPNSNASDTAREIGKSTQSEISDTLKSLKREISNPDGSKDIWYPNGNIKKISADGLNIKMLYYNKDIKETNINEGVVRYYYAETNTWHTQYLDGLEILEFPNGQTEHRHKDGKVAVHFENGSIKIKDPNDREIAEEWRYVDGTVAKIKINGEKNILLPNGQKEIHTADHKRREYPDGTIKIVYPDGSQETRYSNGRVRLKDKEGKLIMDSVS